MDMTGEYRIAAPRQVVWDALNDADTLKQCIAGCEDLERTSETEFTAKVKAKVGPVSAKFNGAVTLSDINPPESYTISGEGKGGAAGFAKGGAKVALAEDGDATILNYEVHVQVGGKLAQIGSRLINSTAKKMADDFFSRLSELLAPAEPETVAAAEPESVEHEPAPTTGEPPEDLDADVGAGAQIGVWVAGTILGVLILLAICCLG